MEDPKKLTAAVVALGALLIGVWALSFLDRKDDPEQGRVAFSLPDPQKALPPTGSGLLVAKAAAPQASKPADRESDALKSLQDEATREVADAPAKAADGSEIPVEGEDENGAPGRPIAEQAGWLGGSGGGSAGGGGIDPSTSGGVLGSSGSGALRAGVGPGTAVVDAGAAARQVQGAAGSRRLVSGAPARSIRSGTVGVANGAAGPGVAAGAGNRFAPSGTSGSAYSAGPGVSGGTPVGGGGAALGGGGAGMRPEGGGSGLDQGPGGNQDNPPGGGGHKDDPNKGGGDKDVKAKKRGEVKQDAAAVLKSAKSYRANVVAKIMAEEKRDVAQVGARSRQANLLLKADVAALQKAEGRLAAFPAAVETLADARGLLADVLPRFAEGGTKLAKAAKTMGKVAAKCGTKAENATALDDGNEADPKGVLQAHRDAVSALRSVAVARVAVGALQADFTKAWPAQEAAVRAVDPKAAKVYKKTAADLDKDLKKVVKSLPATLYPTKGKAKAAKKDMVTKLKPIRENNEKGVKEFQRRHDELKTAHRAYPNTEDLGKAENSAWLAVEGARQVDAEDFASGTKLLKAAETSLPALVIAGENAAEAYLESCDHWAAMKRLAKAAPAK